MNIASPLSIPLRDPHASLGTLDAAAVARLVEAAGDLVLIMDRGGVVVDRALASGDLAIEGADSWVGKRWIDLVTVESRAKVEDMLAAASEGTTTRWRQVNHPTSGGDVPVRYWAVPLGNEGRVAAIGRDLRANAVLQQRLLQVQQSLERDYLRLRQAESRYRVLFERAHDAILIVEADTRRIREANPAATRLLDMADGVLVNRSFTSIADEGVRDSLIAYLGAVSAADQPPMALALPGGRGSVVMSASMFRQDQMGFFLVRLSGGAREDAGGSAMLDMLARMPDAFVLTDGALSIVAANPAFVDMVQAASVERVRSTPLAAYLGRAGIDLDLIAGQVRDHGVARNVATILRPADGATEEVEVSAVVAPSPEGERFGFTIRTVSRRSRDLPPTPRDLPRSVEQLTELVGRMSLKDIVRESTDLIERLCIEAALAYTEDNRASAAEILGLSRQSLYSKLHRHGLGNLGTDEP